jgi:hypothetical protein
MAPSMRYSVDGKASEGGARLGAIGRDHLGEVGHQFGNPPSASEQARHSVGVGGNLSWDCALTRANAPRERGVPKRS